MPAKPYDKLTMLALILAVLFNVSEGFGVLLFTWATVVVLGGFATALNSIDFYIASGILLLVVQKVLNLGRPPKSPNITASPVNDRLQAVTKDEPSKSAQLSGAQDEQSESAPPSRAPEALKGVLKFLGGGDRVRSATDSFLAWYKLVQASILAVLSLWRLLKRDYGTDTANLHKGLNIFYGLSLAYVIPYLFKKFCQYWMIEIEELFKEMTDKYGLSREKGEDVKFIKNYFFAIYSCCINEGISDGLKMDIESYTEQLSDSSHPDNSLAKDLLSKLRRKTANESMNTAMESIQETLAEMPICEDHYQRHSPCHEHEDNCIIS